MKKEILKKFLENACTVSELNMVIRWAEEQAFTKEGEKLVYEDWKNYQEGSAKMDNEKFTTLFNRIQEKIDKEEQKRIAVPNNVSGFQIILRFVTRAAAIMLLPVLGFLLYTLSESRTGMADSSYYVVDSLEVKAPIGSRTLVQLSDGSEVFLNCGSKIKYPQFFSGNTREITLSGEAFFNVKHNPEMPFVVKTESLNIVALGTSFNVLAYADLERIETTLVSGKVVLEKSLINGTKHTIGEMKPGQHIRYNSKNGSIIRTEGNIDKYIGWKDGKLVFDDANIEFVAECLNRTFNVEITVSEDILDYTYTVVFVDETLFQILDLMSIATPIQYTAHARKKLPDGSFTKQKIEIEKR